MTATLTIAPTKYPPRHLAKAEAPLADWIDDLAAWFADLGTDRGALIAAELRLMAADARHCTTPGVPLSVECFLDRRPCLEAERDATPYGPWTDHLRVTTAGSTP